MDTIERQRVLDDEHLRLLSLFHYISGGVTLVISIGFVIMISFFWFMATHLPPRVSSTGQSLPQVAPPVAFFAVFVAFCALGVIYGAVEIFTGRCISRRRRRVFSLIASIPRLITIPYGVLLTVFTIIVLERPSVKELYRQAAGPNPSLNPDAPPARRPG